MDTWENAETLIEDQGILGKRKSRKARELLRKINAPGVLEAMEAACAAPLDKLENAHELGRQLHDRVQTQRDEVQQQLTTAEANQFGIDTLQQAVTTLDAKSTQAQQLLVSDPLGAQQLLEETADQMGQLQQQLEEARGQIERLASASRALGTAQERVAQERAKGMLLQEPDGSPDPMLEQAAQRQTLSRQALARGETDEATMQLDRMVTLIEAAQTIIDEQLAAREFCQQQLGPMTQETEVLRQRLTDARHAHATLQRDFAANAWTDVRENPSRAEELVGRADQNRHEAMGLCADEVQHYFGAANLLRSAEEDQQAAAEMIESLAARLAELESLRTSCLEQMKRATARAYQIDQYFAAHTADRPASNQRFRAAVELLEQHRAEADAPQPDWAALSDQLQTAEAELDKAHGMAQRDVQLHQQAQTELAAAERAIRQARSYYHQGITADVAPARSQYEQAKQLLATQQYEQAIANAAASQRSARRGYDDAVRTGRRRQQQIDRERRWAQAQRPSTTQRPGMFPRIPIPMPNFGGRRPSISDPSHSPSRSASQSHWSGPSGGSSSASSGASQSSW
jgi:exonuclease VII small subunit